MGTKTAEEISAEKAAKPRPDLVPARAIVAAGRAFGYGARKHGLSSNGRGTYRDPVNHPDQCLVATHVASFERHWFAYKSGELIDKESGLAHLDCAAAQLSIVIDLTEDPPVVPAKTVPLKRSVACGCRRCLPELYAE